jgi:hypothetical protein
MQNHQHNPNLSSFLSSNYLNEINSNNFRSNIANNNTNTSLHMRRSSLGNMNSYDENAFVRYNINDLKMSQLRPPIPLSPIYPDSINNDLLNNLNEETFFENENSSSSFSNFHSELNQQGLSNSFLISQMIQQKQQQQQQQQQQVNYLNLSNKGSNYPYMSSPSSNNQNEQNFLFPYSSTQSAASASSSKANLRRRSYHFGQINSLLQPVQESTVTSPICSQQLKNQQQRDLETKLNMLICSNNKVNSQIPMINPSLMTEPQSNMLINQQSSTQKQRMRAYSIGSGALSNTMSSFLSDLSSTNQELGMYQSKSMSNLKATPDSSFMNLRKFDSFEEKLATTGNIFQKRDDWSIINKLPVNKQNTIHMRLEDEGPFGNDEIRCFVLSHFSSLGIKELSCVFCDCNLIIYDRFPLIDGTLFLSPFIYDSKKAISTQLPNKTLQQNSQIQQYQTHKQSDVYLQKEKSQYIYAICLKCLMQEKDHEIKCKNCSKSWQTMGGNSLQIGTLYKYDIFAAFPCCQSRLNCNNCKSHIMNIDSDTVHFFSSYTDEKECEVCKKKDYHFIKPLNDIFIKQSSCRPVLGTETETNTDMYFDTEKKSEILNILNENEE